MTENTCCIGDFNCLYDKAFAGTLGDFEVEGTLIWIPFADELRFKFWKQGAALTRQTL